MDELCNEFSKLLDHLPGVGEDYGYFLNAIFEKVKSLLLGEHAARYEDLVGASDVVSCGHIFEKSELVFQCPVCAVDETCVLCVRCFDKKQHEGHKYRYYPSRGEGGSCDCGETESWKIPLQCVLHGVSSSDNVENTTLLAADEMKGFRDNWLGLTRCIHHLIKTANPAKEFDGGKAVMLLVNDEVHSFDDVITAVSRAIHTTSIRASNVAKIVDLRGYAPIMYFETFPPEEGSSLAKTHERIVEVLTPTELQLQVVPVDDFSKNLVAFGLLVAMEQVIRDIPSLRRVLIVDLITWKPEAVDEDTFALLFFLHENYLPKQVRKTMQSIFTLGLPFTEVKEHLLYCFETSLDSLLLGLPGDREAGGLSMLHFAVQVLTVPSIAQKGCKNGFHRRLCKSVFCRQLNGVTLPYGLQLEWVQAVTQMIRYLCNDESVRRDRLVCRDTDFLRDLLEGLLPFHIYYPKVRMDDAHVEYEGQEFIKELNMTATLLIWLTELATSYAVEDDLLLTITFICGFVRDHLEEVDIFGADAKVFNFFQPIIWFLGLLLNRLYLLQGSNFRPFQIPWDVTLYVARLVAILGEMKEGKWVRNGLEIACMYQFVSSGPTTGQLHLYYIIVLSTMMNPVADDDQSLATELYHMVLGPRHVGENDSEQFLWHHSWFFRMVLGNTLAVHKTEFMRRSIVQALAIGPSSYSAITDLIYGWMEDDAEFEQILGEIAEISQTDALEGSTKYILKREQAHLFNPYCWYYDDKSREKAMENMSQRYGITKYNILRCPPPFIDPYQQLFHGIGRSKWIISFASMFVNTDLDSNDEDTLILSAVLKRFVPEFEIRVDNNEGLRNLKLKIETAVLKRNDLECIRQALESFVIGFGEIDTGGQVPRSSSADAEAIKRRGEERKRKALLAIQQDQAKFSSAHSEELEEQSAVPLSLEMTYNLVESGTCVHCQEPAVDLARTFGVLAALEPLHLCKSREGARSKSIDITILSCFHVMHVDCYWKYVARTKRCPLCRAFVTLLLPTACAVGDRFLPQDAIRSALSLTPAELSDMEEDWQLWSVNRLDEFDAKPESIPMDSGSESLYSQISSEYNLYDLFEQNCRQAISLRGCPEYTNICRIGRLLKSYMLCLPKQKDEYFEALDFRRKPTTGLKVFGVLLSGLLNMFSPLRMRDEWVTWLIYFIRQVIMSGDQSDAPDLGAVIRYLLFVWYEDATWDGLSLEDLFGLDKQGKSLYVPSSSMSLTAEPFPPNFTTLIPLPEELSEFFVNSELPRSCPECGSNYRTPWLLCLNCGEQCCPSDQCSQSYLDHVAK